MGLPRARPHGISARLGDGNERGQRGMQEPAQPHALAASSLAHPVHAVVPVARAHQRQAVRAHGKAEIEAARAMLEQRCLLVGLVGLEIEIVLAGTQRRPVEERHPLVEDRRIAGDLDIGGCDRGEPGAVV